MVQKGIINKFICMVAMQVLCQFLKHHYCLQYDASFVIMETQQ